MPNVFSLIQNKSLKLKWENTSLWREGFQNLPTTSSNSSGAKSWKTTANKLLS